MLVSFCVPTYNRKIFLEELLNSIDNQKKPNFDVEVCISDNASTDGTDCMIDIWRSRFNFPIVYKRNNENLGPDRNFLESVSLAKGDYCWIFGSDDALAEDALVILESYLYSDGDIYLCDRCETGYNLTEIKNPHRSWLRMTDKLNIFKDEIDRISYFRSCLSLGGVFSYLSSLVVKRQRWAAVKFDDSFIGTSYPHVFIMMNILNNNECRLHYISRPLVICRGDNDTFEHKGKAHRIKIDFVGYFKLADTLYANNPMLKKEFENILLSERPWMYTTLAVACYGNKAEKNDISDFYARLGYPKSLTGILLKFGFLAKYAKNIDFIKKILKKSTNEC